MRILHFSDFHLEGDGVSFSEHMIDRMLEVLKPINHEKKFDLILFTGDMIDKGGRKFKDIKTAYDTFHRVVINKLCTQLDLPENCFYACPGNHEVNRNLVNCKKDYDLEHNLNSQDAISWYLRENKENDGFSERLRDYDTYFRQNWLKKVSKDHFETVKLADHFIISVDGRKIGISTLNSAWRCGKKTLRKNASILTKIGNIFRKAGKKVDYEYYETKNNDENKTIIGRDQISEAISFFNSEDIALKLSLAHHHFSLLGIADSTNMRDAFISSYDMSFFGHTHHEDALRYGDDDMKVVTAIAPGVISKNIYKKEDYRNGFSVWDVNIASGVATERRFFQNEDSGFKQDMNYGYDGSGMKDWLLGNGRFVIPFSEEIAEFASHEFIDSDEIVDLRKSISEVKDLLLLYGVPGIGKTHLLTKCFPDSSNVLYCKSADLDRKGRLYSQVAQELTLTFKNNKSNDKILIVDNASVDSFKEVRKLRHQEHSQMPVICVVNEMDEEKDKYEAPVIKVTPDLYKSGISKYVDERIADYNVTEAIKRYSDGFPGMAISLVDQARKESKVEWEKMSMHSRLLASLGVNLHGDKELEELLEVMSMFFPFPKLENDSMAAWGMKNLSSLHSRTREEIVNLIRSASKIWNGALLESTPSGYTVRPFPVAISLANSWIEKHKNSDKFASFLDELASLPNEVRGPMVSALCSRLRDMDKSEAARHLLKRLTDPGGVFRSGNVVLSPMGSQLILAISDVNPAVVAAALRSVMADLPADGIRDLNWHTRRNLVSSLTRLAYYPEAFEDAQFIMSRFAAYETEDNLSNNSTGCYIDLFHILLPGTKASLCQRMEWLDKYSESYAEVKELLPKAMRGVFAMGQFMRMGGLGPRGQKTEDYSPSYAEVRDYWESGANLIEKNIKSESDLTAYSSIISDNLMQWARGGVILYAKPLIDVVLNHSKDAVKILESDFNHIIDLLKEISDIEGIGYFESIRDLLVKSDICSRLQSKQNEFYSQKHSSFEPENEITFLRPTVEEFINSGNYRDQSIWNELLGENKVLFWPFCAALNEIVSDDQLRAMYSAISDCSALKDDMISPMLLTFVSMSRKRIATVDFVESIYERGYFSLFTALMARIEDESLNSYVLLQDRFKDKEFAFLEIYLSHVSLYDESMRRLLSILAGEVHNNPYIITRFVITHYNFVKLEGDVLKNCKYILLHYDLSDSNARYVSEYSSFCIRLLKAKHDERFALQIYDKFINASYAVYDKYSFLEVFKCLLINYKDVTLESLTEAMINANMMSVAWRLSEDLGSGMGFGKGEFFKQDKDILLNVLDKHGLPAAKLYARMCPIFEVANDGNEVFSEWMNILLDGFGDSKEILNNLSSNMGSYMWSGSVVPLLDKKIRCFRQLMTHCRPEVRKWAKSNIQYLKSERDAQLYSEDFESRVYS